MRGQKRASVSVRAPYIHRQIATFDILSEEGLCLIEQNADTILRDIGMEFHNDAEILDLFRAAGADVQGERVRFEAGMCRSIIQATAPERLRSPVNPGLTHGHSKTQDRSGAGGAQPHQREGGRAGDKGGGVRASGQGWDRSNRPSEPLRPRSNNGA